MFRLLLSTLLVGVAVLLMACGSRELRNAQKFIDVKEYSRARELITIELQADPKNVDAYLLLGRVELFVGDQPAADAAFEKALLVNTGAKQDIAKAYVTVAESLYKSKERSLLPRAYFTKAVTYDPGIANSIADWCIATGKAETTAQRTADPVGLLTFAASLSPDRRSKVAAVLNDTGNAYAQKTFYAEAAQYAMAAGETDPNLLRPAAATLRAIGLAVPIPDQEGWAQRCLTKALQWNPDLLTDEDVIWTLYVRLPGDTNAGIVEYLQKFPSGRHRAEAEQLQRLARPPETPPVSQDPSASPTVGIEPRQAPHNTNGASGANTPGGTITTVGPYTVHTFTTNGTFTVPLGTVKIDVLIVGAGSGGNGGIGGVNYGAGGAGGTVIYRQNYPVHAGSYAVLVGQGGTNCTAGQDSSFDTLVATGGRAVALNNRTGGDNARYTGGGNPGGQFSGGGAGANGGGSGLAGGAGYATNITGTMTCYGGGGGGGSSAVTTGTCGAGNGDGSLGPNNGAANTGGGGGGYGSTGNCAGAGGSGIVIIRYALAAAR